MSADLSYTANGAAELMLGSNTPAWHGEGTVIKGLATAAEAIEFAHLGWEVEKFPIYCNNPLQAGQLEIADNYAMMRKDNAKVLGIVGKQYTPVQNKNCFNFFDPIIDRNLATYESAGALDEGRRVWLLAKLPDSIIVNGKDPVEKYLLLANSHNGTSTLKMKLTNTRIVYANTLAAAESDKGESYAVRHTAGIANRADEAIRLLGLANKQFDKVAETYNHMAQVQVDSTMLAYFLNVVLPQTGLNPTKIQNARDTVQHLFEGQAKGYDLAGKSVWGL